MRSTRLVSTVSLAIGLGLAVALVSFADAIFLRPLPVARPGEIVRVYSASPMHSLGYVSYPDYEDFARGARTLAGVVAQSQILLAAGGGAGEVPEVRMGLAVTPNYFDVLGVPAELGRTFLAQDARAPVVVLADAYWRERFSGSSAVIGKAISLSGVPFTIIGVSPRGFGLDRFLHEDFYVPIGVYGAGILPSSGHPLTDRGRRYLSVYARLAAPLPAVEGELVALAAGLAREYPDTDHDQKARVLTDFAARSQSEGGLQAIAWVLLALALLSILIACATAAGLLVLDREARAGDTALKILLGARPLRLLRESLAESLALAAVGATAAMPLAWAALKGGSRLLAMPTDLRMSIDARLDARMVAAAGGAALLTALLCAAAPWFMMLRIRPGPASARVTQGSGLRHGLVVIQIGMASALVAVGVNWLCNIAAARNIDLGYRTDHVLLLTFDPSQAGIAEAPAVAFYRELLRRTSQLPGVRAAALAQSVPLGFTGEQKEIKIDTAADSMGLWMNTVTPGYFALMRLPLLAGRDFNIHDTADSPPVVIINQALARLWPDGNALGRTLEIGGRSMEIAGIVKTAKYFQPSESPRPFFYLTQAQNYVPRMTLHVQTQGPPADAAPAVLALAHALDPMQPISDIRPLDRYFERSALFSARIGVGITAAAGTSGLLLALVGLYSCVSSAVNHRRRELGIRRALGASRWEVIRLVVIQGIRLSALGVTTGLGLALAAQRFMQLWTPAASTESHAVLSAILAGSLVVAASTAACVIPAWRATRFNPAVTLRAK